MKAIKLASIFAVSAIAAAVSTTTIAAEPVFSGTAAISYTNYGDSASTADNFSGIEGSELELAVDTGVVYIEIEFGGDANADETANIGIEKAYVTQGAVQFGRFDGTLSDAAALGVNENSGVDIIGTSSLTSSDTDDTGIRYSLSDELTVAVEGTESTGVSTNSEVGVTASYIADMGPGTFGISGGVVGDSSAMNFGYSMDVSGTTVAASYGSGETSDELEETSAAVSAQMSLSDAVSLNVEYTSYTSETAAGVETDKDGLYVYASYTAGDLEYYVEHYGKEWGDSTEVGVAASF